MTLLDQVVGAARQVLSGSQTSDLGQSLVEMLGTQLGGVKGLAQLFNDKGLGEMVSPQGSAPAPTSRSRIDLASNGIMHTVVTGDYSEGIAVSPDGTRVFITNGNSPGRVSVVNTASNAVMAEIPVAGVPRKIAITPNSATAYVTHGNSSKALRRQGGKEDLIAGCRLFDGSPLR